MCIRDRRNQAQEWVDNLVERSRKTSDQVLDLVRHEVAAQLDRIDGKSLEAIANQVAEILKKSAAAGRSATKDVTKQAGKAAKDVTTQASKTAQGVRSRAGKTVTQARAAATKVTPSRKHARKKADGHKTTAKKAPATKKAPEAKKAPKKAAS